MPPLDECYDQENCFARLAVLENQQMMMMEQNDKILEKLDDICPAVRENSWWVEKLKWGFVMVAVVGVAMGIVAWIKHG